MEKKTCSKCKQTMPATTEYFYVQKRGKHGIKSTCKECDKAANRKRRSSPEAREKHRLYAIEWRKNNPERTKEINKACRDRNKERINRERRERYWNDPEFRAKKIEQEKRYKESGGRAASNRKPENMEKARIRSRKRRQDPEKKAHDYKRNQQWRRDNKDYLDKLHAKNRNQLAPSYVAQTLKMSVKDLTPEVLETKRLIIQLKRELKKNNVKIR